MFINKKKIQKIKHTPQELGHLRINSFRKTLNSKGTSSTTSFTYAIFRVHVFLHLLSSTRCNVPVIIAIIVFRVLFKNFLLTGQTRSSRCQKKNAKSHKNRKIERRSWGYGTPSKRLPNDRQTRPSRWNQYSHDTVDKKHDKLKNRETVSVSTVYYRSLPLTSHWRLSFAARCQKNK